MFKQQHKGMINGRGMVFRFITSILITIALWIISDMKSDMKDIKLTVKEFTVATTIYNTNHLAHHTQYEVEISGRLASIETILKRLEHNE